MQSRSELAGWEEARARAGPDVPHPIPLKHTWCCRLEVVFPGRQNELGQGLFAEFHGAERCE